MVNVKKGILVTVASAQARRSGCDSLGKEVEKLRAALDESVSDREQLRTDVQHLREAVADIESEMDTLRSTRANLTDENRAMAENLQRYETTMKDIISLSGKDIEEEVRKQFAFLQTRHESERESFAKENSALRDEIDSLHRQNEQLREESKLIAELNAQLKSREEIETRREHLYMEKLSVMENLLQESNGEIGALQSELGEYKIAYENLKDQFSGVRRQVAYCDESKEKGDLKQQISDLLEKSEEQPTNDEETFHELSQLVAEKQTEVDSLRQKLARLEDGVVRELSTDHERESATTSHRNLDLQAQIENLQEAIGDLKAELERQSLGRKSAEDDVDRQRLQIDAKQKIIEELEMQIEEIRVTKSSKEDESYRIDDVTLRQLFLSLFTGMGCGRSPCRISQMALAAPDEKLHDLVLSFIRASSANEITRVCDLSSIPAQAKNEAISECNKGSHERAATILVEAAQQKLRESTRELSGAGGKRMLKSDHGTYIRAYDREWKVDLKRGMAWSWEHWYVEDWGCKVVFKAIHSPGRFMRALPNGNVDLVPTNPKECPASMWKPFNNSDGTWSFLSIHGTWLSGLRNGIVCCQWECNSSEKFTLPSW